MLKVQDVVEMIPFDVQTGCGDVLPSRAAQKNVRPLLQKVCPGTLRSHCDRNNFLRERRLAFHQITSASNSSSMASYVSPLASATGGLEFSRLAADQIKRISVKRIHVAPALDSMLGPIPGGLHDPALGAILALEIK